jgi:hypothetical protein
LLNGSFATGAASRIMVGERQFSDQKPASQVDVVRRPLNAESGQHDLGT